MTVFLFLLTTAILTAEGLLLLRGVMKTCTDILYLLLGYPIGLFLNALLFYALFLAGIPFRPATGIILAHAALIAFLVAFAWMRPGVQDSSSLPPRGAVLPRWLQIFCITSILLVLVTNGAAAMIFPSFYWDAFTNWNMRSLQTLTAGTFVFDVAKPQYPPLIHATHVAFTMVTGWNDRTANAATLLLSLTSLLSIFLIMRRTHGQQGALLALTAVTIVPLLSIHLRQGYADIHVTTFLMLSALVLDWYRRSGRSSLLLLSAILCAGAAWTKLEGLYFGVAPWLLLISAHAARSRQIKTSLVVGILPLLILAVPWPLTVNMLDLQLTPHGTGFTWRPDVLPLLVKLTFAGGSFGIHWYAILLGLAAIALAHRKCLRPLLSDPLLVWGILTTLIAFVIYTCTKDVEGLISRNGFLRTMLIPTLLLTQAVTLAIARVLQRSDKEINPYPEPCP